MPKRFSRKEIDIVTAATGLTFTALVPVALFRGRALQMTLVCPNYTTGTPTTTISIADSAGIVYFTDSARAEAATYQVALTNIVMLPGDVITATLSGVAGGIHTVRCIFHIEE